jgi:hypothetical protein
MDTKHNQHVLPKLYLKGFVIKKDEPFIWVYQKGQHHNPGGDRYNRRDTNGKNPYIDTIKNAGAELDFYADPNEDGTKDFDTTENKLMSLEQQHDQIFHKLRAHHRITKEEKERFSSYIVLMHRRVRAGRELSNKLMATKGIYEPTKELFQKLGWPDTPETRAVIKEYVELKSQDGNYQIRGHNELTVRSPDSLLIDALKQMVWTFYVAPNSQSFFTGDNPVFIPKDNGLAKNNSELSFPIATDVALNASWDKRRKEGFEEARSQIVKEINRRTASQASKIYFFQNQDWVVKMLNKGDYGWHPVFAPKSVYTVAELVKNSPDSEPHLKINV